MRGKRGSKGKRHRTDGITPAGAGKTVYDLQGAMHDEDHPRRCGENATHTKWAQINLGSPPQVRGKLSGFSFPFRYLRITPAGAGKTQCRCRQARRCGDHPRRCGENDTVMDRRADEDRITPAGAGKTRTDGSYRCRAGDHPRRCGENVLPERTEPSNRGSPPQVRGKPCAEAGSGKSGRITPAGAGKTPIEDNAFAEIRDHPRRCGENDDGDISRLRDIGSPPQVRGKRR